MRKAWQALIALTMIAVGSTMIVLSNSHATVHEPSAEPSVNQADPPTFSSTVPEITFTGVSFASWALLDRKTGAIIGSTNLTEPGDTMSMIKAWIAADYLRKRTSIPERAVLRRLSIMIRDSDNDAAVEFHRINGQAESIDRMVMICGLTESHAGRVAYRWSDTVVSARDTARLGACIADGHAAGPWTDWLLTQMRGVRGEGDFGPRKALPRDVAKQVAIKNGWITREDGKWHYACMAVSDSWSLGILMRYPVRLGGGLGRSNCQAAAAQLLPLLRL